MNKTITQVNEYESYVQVKVTVGDQKPRVTKLRAGDRYTVEPPNPKKLKHRGRPCIYMRLIRPNNFAVAEVKFLDTGRLGRVDLEDLVEA